MTLHIELEPLVHFIAGILVLAVPRLLNYIVGVYLIVLGVLGMVQIGADAIDNHHPPVTDSPYFAHSTG